MPRAVMIRICDVCEEKRPSEEEDPSYQPREAFLYVKRTNTATCLTHTLPGQRR